MVVFSYISIKGNIKSSSNVKSQKTSFFPVVVWEKVFCVKTLKETLKFKFLILVHIETILKTEYLGQIKMFQVSGDNDLTESNESI